MSFFHADGKMYRFLCKLIDICKLNGLWLMFSLPIFTIGASTVAAYEVGLKMVDDEEGYLLKAYRKAFFSNFKKGTILWGITLIAIYAVYLDFQLFEAIEGNPIIFLMVGILSMIVTISLFLYAYPLLARYENTLLETLKNSAEICRRYAGKTLLLSGLLVVEFFIFQYNSTMLFLGILMGPAFMILTVSGISKRIFMDIEKRNHEGDF